jgi:hypothetical protein
MILAKFWVALTFAIVLLCGCGTIQVEEEKYSTIFQIENLDWILYRQVRVEAVGDNYIEAIGTVLGDGYVFALSHATSFKKPFTSEPEGDYFVNEEPARLVGRRMDVSVFYCEAFKDIEPLEWGDSDLLPVGAELIIFGWPRAFGIVVHRGHKSRPNVPDGFFNKYPSHQDWRKKNAYAVSVQVTPGDSGSAVLAKRSGKWELVGIVVGTYDPRTGWGVAFASNYLKSEVWKIINADKNKSVSLKEIP